MKDIGWVYVIKTEGMPSILKVGYTLSTPYRRAKQLESTSSPYNYYVKLQLLTKNPRKLEKLIHKELNNYRVNKEWFNCDLTDVINIINNKKDDFRFIFIEENNENDIYFGSKLAWFSIKNINSEPKFFKSFTFPKDNINLIYYSLVKEINNIDLNKEILFSNKKTLDEIVCEIRKKSNVILENYDSQPIKRTNIDENQAREKIITKFKNLACNTFFDEKKAKIEEEFQEKVYRTMYKNFKLRKLVDSLGDGILKERNDIENIKKNIKNKGFIIIPIFYILLYSFSGFNYFFIYFILYIISIIIFESYNIENKSIKLKLLNINQNREVIKSIEHEYKCCYCDRKINDPQKVRLNSINKNIDIENKKELFNYLFYSIDKGNKQNITDKILYSCKDCCTYNYKEFYSNSDFDNKYKDYLFIKTSEIQMTEEYLNIFLEKNKDEIEKQIQKELYL